LLVSGCSGAYSKGYEEQREVWLAHLEAGREQRDAGALSEAVESHRECVALVERALLEHPDDPEIKGDLAEALLNYGDVLHCVARYDESKSALDKATAAVHEAAVREDLLRAKITLASIRYLVGRNRLRAGAHDDALTAMEDAKRIFASLKAQNELPTSYFEFFDQVVQGIRMVKVAELASRDWPAARSLAPPDQHAAHFFRVMHFLRQSDLSAALGANDEWTRVQPVSGEDYYYVACGQALIVEEIGKQHLEPNEEQRALREKHVAAALSALRSAAYFGYRNITHAAFDVDLLSLRELPEFREFVGLRNGRLE
jgi:tetratricopeptide (TPR) repeat protein